MTHEHDLIVEGLTVESGADTAVNALDSG